jgi:hypothetical protein
MAIYCLAQLTVFIALAAGIIFQTSPEKLNLCPRILLDIAGALFGILFLLMSFRVCDYWDKRVEQAKKIEDQLNIDQYRSVPKKRFINNRTSVACVYCLSIIVFVLMALSEIKIPIIKMILINMICPLVWFI